MRAGKYKYPDNIMDVLEKEMNHRTEIYKWAMTSDETVGDVR